MNVKVLLETSIKTLNKIYEYYVPPDLEKDVEIGKRVKVNFGSGVGNEKEGVIVKIDKDGKDEIVVEKITKQGKTEKSVKLKNVECILDEVSYISQERLKLAKWIARVCFCNVYDAIKLMLPSLGNEKLMPKTLQGKQALAVCLAKPSNEIQELIDTVQIKSIKKVKLLKYLLEYDFIYLDDVISNLDISRAIVNGMVKSEYVCLYKQDVPYEDYSNILKTCPLTPTDEQHTVINGICEKIRENKYSMNLLRGVTGSGKTEVYLQIIAECLKLSKKAIVLVPEIALTYQTKVRFVSRFGDKVSVLHSKMTMLQKQTEYKRILTNQVDIVIGPRSALFVPLENIGLIVIDEEHDSSYVSQTTPRYNAKKVASYIAYQNNAVVLLGSATPEIATMYKAKSGQIELYQMLKRPGEIVMPKVEIVDMKKEKLLSSTNISQITLESIKENIANNHQTFVYINRRGYSSYITCKACGKTIKCRNCDVDLTYHKQLDMLLCHYCSYTQKNTDVCPYCQSDQLVYGGIGTEQIDKELHELIPSIKTLRMDADTTIKRGSHEEILNKFKNERIDVLVGTQMISKGHDISNVTLVCIINADAALCGNDYLSVEKGFASLLQVSGRAGRGEYTGNVIIQAYDLDNYALNCLKNQNYDEFYDQEIDFRKNNLYPPFVDIVMLELKCEGKSDIMQDAKAVYDIFNQNKNNLYTIYSPKIPYVSKIKNKFYAYVIIKTKICDKVLDVLYENLAKCDKILKKGCLISVETNPLNMN